MQSLSVCALTKPRNFFGSLYLQIYNCCPWVVIGPPNPFIIWKCICNTRSEASFNTCHQQTCIRNNPNNQWKKPISIFAVITLHFLVTTVFILKFVIIYIEVFLSQIAYNDPARNLANPNVILNSLRPNDEYMRRIITTIGSYNGLSPGRHQNFNWTNARTWLIGPLGTNFSEIWLQFKHFHWRKYVSKCRVQNVGRPLMLSHNWHRGCGELGLNSRYTFSLLAPTHLNHKWCNASRPYTIIYDHLTL